MSWNIPGGHLPGKPGIDIGRGKVREIELFL